MDAHRSPPEPGPTAVRSGPAPGKLPAPQDVTADSIGRSPAVRLFVDLARAVAPDSALSDASAREIEIICRRLDGIPLAIELTAARLRHMTLGDLAARLTGATGALPVLTGGPKDAPARHRTIRDTIAWSYELLSGTDRAVLSRRYNARACLRTMTVQTAGVRGVRVEPEGEPEWTAKRSSRWIPRVSSTGLARRARLARTCSVWAPAG